MSIVFGAFAGSGGQLLFYVFAVIAMLIGLLIFVRGFRIYREYRIVADTPMIPVRSAPMGLVHVQGKTTGDDRLTSPLTGVPCYYYRVQVEQWVEKDDKKEWESVRNDNGESKFYLEDATGKILVDPHNAEYELPQTFRAEIGPDSNRTRFVDASLGVPGPSEQDLRAYMTGDFTRARETLKAMQMPGTEMLDKALAVGEKMQSLGASLRASGISMDFGGGQTYRFTETCLLADRDCNLLGTCTENPSPAGEHDRNILRKGQNEKTFLITTKFEKQIEKSLRSRAFVMVAIGAVLIVGGAALALHAAGML
jgi:hypothetical protein